MCWACQRCAWGRGLLLSHFSRVRLCATPQTAAHQAPPSLGFSRQEYWSGLPFSSPMHESEKWKWSRSVVSDSWWPHGLQPIRLLCPWDFPGKSTGVGCHCLLQRARTSNRKPCSFLPSTLPLGWKTLAPKPDSASESQEWALVHGHAHWLYLFLWQLQC